MTTSILSKTLPTELGEAAAEGIGAILAKATAGSNISTFVEGAPPVTWADLANAEWDRIGIVEDGEGASLRDLAEFAQRWGYSCVQLPLIPTILAKRHSTEAAASNGPVTFSLSAGEPEGPFFAPFGQIDGISFLSEAGNETGGALVPMPQGASQSFAPTFRGTLVTTKSVLSSEFRRELAVLWAAESAGAARRLLEEAVAYVKEREQFGRPVGTFQAVKHRLANALIAAESAEAAVIWASLDPDGSHRAAAFAVDQGIAVAEAAIQVHGGLGFTWEMGLHFYLKHMLQIRDLLGGLANA